LWPGLSFRNRESDTLVHHLAAISLLHIVEDQCLQGDEIYQPYGTKLVAMHLVLGQRLSNKFEKLVMFPGQNRYETFLSRRQGTGLENANRRRASHGRE